MIRLALLALTLLAPMTARACEPVPVPELREGPDSPAVLYSDGSFDQAGTDDWWEFLDGRPLRDIGGGRVGQVIVAGLGNCLFYERLLVVDCTRAEGILVDGLSPPPGPSEPGPMSQSLEASARALQPPYGPLALTSATTVAEVAALAAREGWNAYTDIRGWAASRGPQNAFDPFMGCKIFYPNSVGATQ
jgi:hypothetical protein